MGVQRRPTRLPSYNIIVIAAVISLACFVAHFGSGFPEKYTDRHTVL
jgi:hypothetical protein